MKKISSFLCLLIAAAMLASCGVTPTVDKEGTFSETETGVVATSARDAETEKTEIQGNFTIETTVADGYTQSNGVYTIVKGGEYTLSGKLTGQIVVEAPEDEKVELILSEASVSCGEDSPIRVLSADKVTVKALENTYNEISDTRALRTEDSDEVGAAAIYAKTDLTISGSGALVVSAGYNNGIHTTKDLTVKKLTLKVTAPNNALKGNDSVTVESGEILLISTGGDGIKTEDSDISSKGNQRGNITVTGGTLTVYAACDALDASYDVDISGDANVTAYTASYSEYTGEIVQGSGSEFYLIVPSAFYTSATRFAVYFTKDGEETGVWANATYETMVSGGRSRYYGLLVDIPTGYDTATFYRFADSAENSLTEYQAVSDATILNTEMNAYQFTSLSGGRLYGDFVMLQISSSSGGNSEKSEYSAKGLKADNEIRISGGVLTLTCGDDGLHASSGATLENGETGKGNLTISGGTLTISSADDGLHADATAKITDGTVIITKSYEGIEGNAIEIDGGHLSVVSSDDGLNACDGTQTPSIRQTGGYLSVKASGDGVDSNGSLYMDGGVMLVAQSGGGNGPIDIGDTSGSEFVITGGVLVAYGTIFQGNADNASSKSTQGSIRYKLSGKFGTSVALKDADGTVLLAVTLQASAANIYLSAPGLQKGESYQICTGGTYADGDENGFGTGGTYEGGSTAAQITLSSLVYSNVSGGTGGGGSGGGPGGGGFRW